MHWGNAPHVIEWALCIRAGNSGGLLVAADTGEFLGLVSSNLKHTQFRVSKVSGELEEAGNVRVNLPNHQCTLHQQGVGTLTLF